MTPTAERLETELLAALAELDAAKSPDEYRDAYAALHDRMTANVARALLATIADLRATVAEAGWRTMDSAPRDGTHVLLRVPFRGGFFYAAEGAYQAGEWNSACRDNVEPTHWAPKPTLSQHGGSNAE